MANFSVEFQEHSKSFGVKFEDHSSGFEVDFGDIIVLSDVGETYILVDANGNEVVGVVVDNEVVFDATPNDIRIGKTAATEEGVTEGTKEIPSYHTNEGYRLILNGRPCTLSLAEYDYTKLQAIFCSFNTTLLNSVSAEKVSINDNVYDVRSTEVISEVKKDDSSQHVDFGISNNSGKPYLIRYFMYKEIY